MKHNSTGDASFQFGKNRPRNQQIASRIFDVLKIPSRDAECRTGARRDLLPGRLGCGTGRGRSIGKGGC